MSDVLKKRRTDKTRLGIEKQNQKQKRKHFLFNGRTASCPPAITHTWRNTEAPSIKEPQKINASENAPNLSAEIPTTLSAQVNQNVNIR